MGDQRQDVHFSLQLLVRLRPADRPLQHAGDVDAGCSQGKEGKEVQGPEAEALLQGRRLVRSRPRSVGQQRGRLRMVRRLSLTSGLESRSYLFIAPRNCREDIAA